MSLIILLSASLPLAAASPKFCWDAVPLSLEQSIPGYATSDTPMYYELDATERTFLITEAHEIGLSPESPKVRLLDQFCRPLVSNLPIKSIHGRHIHHIETTSTYFVEVSTAGLAHSNFQMTTWLTQEMRSATSPLKSTASNLVDIPWDPSTESEEEEEEEPSEPFDEWIEAHTDPLPIVSTLWHEIAGHGLLELAAKPNEQKNIRFHTLCPRDRGSDLSSTYTCSRQLRLEESGTTEIRLAATDRPEMLGLDLVRSGRLTVDAHVGMAHLFDAHGRFVTDLASGEPVELDARRYYLRVELPLGPDALGLKVDLD